MAIVTGGAEGIEATTAAMNETLATQAQANGTDEIVVSDTLANVNNGQITAPTGYDGRKCILREGAGDEETRLITGEVAGTGTTRILAVGEPWVAAPASGESIHISYSSDDMEALTGMALNSKTGVYEGGTTREWQIGQGTNFAYVAVFNFQGWELPDRGATDPALTVRNRGRLDFGYEQAGEGVQGALVTAIHNTATELAVEIESGGILRVYASLFRSWLVTTSMILRAGADVVSKGWTIKDFTDDLLLLVGLHEDLVVSGSGGSGELVQLAEEGIYTGPFLFVDLAGITTETSDTSTETIIVRDPILINVLPLFVIEANKTWRVINLNREIEESDQSELDFSNATANGFDQEFSLDPVIQDAAGTKINGARVFIYEGTRLDDLVLELTSDSDGLAPSSWVYKNFVEATASTLTVLTDGAHALRVDNYGDFPFVSAQTSNAKFEGAVVLNPDPAVAEATQATAITAGSGVVFNTDANPSEIFDFTAGSGTALDGMILTFSPSGAVGTLTKVIDGDSVAGTIHLNARDGTAIANGDTFSRTGGTAGTFSGTYTNSTTQAFSRWIQGNAKSFQIIHDYFAARTAEASGTFTAEAEIIHEWGKANEARVLYLGASGWFTNRSAGEGVIVVNGGVGTVEFFTDDAGATYVPPVSVVLKVTVLDKQGAAVQNARVGIFDGATELMNELTTGLGVAQENFTYTIDVDVSVRVRKGSAAPKYIPVAQNQTITASGLDITITVEIDDNNST